MTLFRFAIIAMFALFSPLSFSQQRIVTAGGSITEVIYLLNANDKLVGVDMSSTYPPEVKSVPQVGYWKQLSIEGILSLKPSLFISWQDAGPTQIFEQLASANVDVLTLQRVPNNLALLYTNIQKIGDKIGKSEEAKHCVLGISKQMDALAQRVNKQADKPNVLFLLSMSGITQIAGKHTVADSLIALAGGHNMATHNNYKNYSSEALILANPDVLVVTSQSVEAIGGIANLAKIAGIEQTTAWKNKRIVSIDQSLILGMGPRVGQAVTELYTGFYGE